MPAEPVEKDFPKVTKGFTVSSDEVCVDVYVARQPILDGDLKTFGHELLYRSGTANFYAGTNPTLASLEVINNSLFSFDIGQLVGEKRAFINFDHELLLQDAALILPPEAVVLEILETTVLDSEIMAACGRLRDRGYPLAADDVAAVNQMQPLLEIADFIKVDFHLATPEERKKIIDRYGARHICLAEKLETQEDFEEAKRLGYRLFQGYFFARPAVLKGQQIPGYKLNYLRILSAVQRPDIEFSELEKLILQEPSVAYKLLRYANSALFAQRSKVDSIKRALIILGERELRKWASIVLLLHLASDKPDALINCALIRAHFCEALAQLSGNGGRKSDFFLLGMFSLLDAMTGSALESALRQISLPSEVESVLLGGDPPRSPFSAAYRLVQAYEQGNWQAVGNKASVLGVEGEEVRDTYLEAVNWCETVFRMLPEFGGGLGTSAKPVPGLKNAPVYSRR
jgi:c-di-GMP-related signal transduction protein